MQVSFNQALVTKMASAYKRLGGAASGSYRRTGPIRYRPKLTYLRLCELYSLALLSFRLVAVSLL